jgi:hypothetical protein
MRAVRCWDGPVGDEGAGRTERREVAPLDVRRRQEAAELVVVPRCPRCHWALVARMGRHGPCFPCRCTGEP